MRPFGMSTRWPGLCMESCMFQGLVTIPAAINDSAQEMRLEDVSRRFGEVVALDRVALHVQAGELMALLGPSGCGKTTALRIIAGFEKPDIGRVLIGGRDLVRVPTNRRRLGMVFQDYSLFPHMTAGANVAFGLRMARVPAADRDARVRRMLDMVRLSGMEDRYPHQLSGGQQQRVALARALVTNPSLLLLDEPLAALDKNLREAMQFELRRIQSTIGITTIMVTHDQEEALTLADRVAVMNSGKVLQVGSPQQIYEFPTSRFVSEFLGTSNLFELAITGFDGALAIGTLPGTAVTLRLPATSVRGRTQVAVAVRPEKLRVEAADQGAEIVGYVFRGTHHAYELRIPGHATTVFAYQQAQSRTHDRVMRSGDSVALAWEPEDVIVFDD
jgi:putative spermidine/putrescine transport system ATP-binding protein